MIDEETQALEKRLAVQAAEGDERAFAELMTRHKNGLIRLASRFSRNRAEVEDLVQESFVRAYRGLPGFRRESSFGHWLRRIAANVCLDHVRARKREACIPLDDLAVEPCDEKQQAAELRRENAQYVDSLLARLSPRDRLVLTLLDLEEMSVAEVAAVTGLSGVNVRVRAFRARGRLRKMLEGNHD
ncbi:sigma-70 family RNA polymerase sigma factor [Desulfovibrio aminophilus]|uniref:RNA polymerase sigma factor n=1 Tax=Desulfovibrio aminophilus TaxID=81425 RepID=UPI003399A938